MSGFAGFSLPVVIAGALALALVLLALQRLRVRRAVIRAPTAMFWRIATHAAPARVLHDRFRHWLAYLLALLIALAVWCAGGWPQRTATTPGAQQVYYLDASAAMTAPGVFDAARNALLADLHGVAAARRSVWLGDTTGTQILAPGEPIALLPARLATVRAGLFPSAYPAWTERLRKVRGTGQPTLHYYGNASAWRAGGRAAPGSVAGYLAPPIADNRGIVALGARPAASGAWDRADVLIGVAAAHGPAPDARALAITLDGAPLPATDDPARAGRVVLRDLPAAGGLLDVALRRGDGFSGDDHAVLRLPRRQRIRVALVGRVPAPVEALLAADPALERIADAAHADVLIAGAGAPALAGRTALLLTDPAAQPAAFAFTTPGGGDAALLDDAMDQLGLAKFDAAALADRLHRPIGVSLRDGPARHVAIWADIVADGDGFARSAAMPLMLSQAIRWLAMPEPWIASAPAGRALIDLDRAEGLAEAPDLAARRIGGEIVLAAAGATRIGSHTFSAVLADPATTRGVAEAPPPGATNAPDAQRRSDLPFALLILAAMGLLALEWLLFPARMDAMTALAPAPIVFLHPVAGWLLLALPLLWWPRLWHAAQQRGRRAARIHAALRSALFTILVLALMGPTLVFRTTGNHRVLVVDRADWAAAWAQPRGRARATALVERMLGGGPGLALVELGEGRSILADAPRLAAALAPGNAQHVTVPRGALALALEQAAAQIPPGASGSIVFAGAGLARDNAWGAALTRLVDRQIAVDVLPLDDADQHPQITRIDVAALRVGERARARLTLAGTAATPLRVELLSGSRRLALSDPVAFAPAATLDLSFPADAAGFMPVRARLIDARGTPLATGQRDTVVAVQDPLRLLYLGERQHGAAARLQTLLGKGFAVDPRDPADLPPALDLAGWQAALIDDLPAARLAAPLQQRVLRSVAESGTGLFFSGGAAAFAGGGWAGTPIARALPVTLRQDQKLEQPSVALVVVIDTSGSMAGEPLDLAKQLARYAVARLTPADSVGVVEFYGAKQWSVPLQPARDVKAVERAIGQMQAQGSSILYPAIQEAYYALKSSTARYRHILVISDAGVEEQRYETLLTRAAQERITVSTALVGADQAGEARMAQWARWGGGRYYAVPDAFSLVDIDLRQPQTKPLPGWRQGGFAVTAPPGAAMWQGMRLNGVPSLAGYVPVGARDRAETLLRSGSDPLLATWQVGNGRVTALMTTPLGEGTRGWQGWRGYGAWLGQILARTANQQPPAALTLARSNGRVALTLRRADPAGPPPIVRIADRIGAPPRASVPLDESAPGIFVGSYPAAPDQPLLAEATIGATTLRAALGGEAGDARPTRLSLAGLAQLTGGSLLDDRALPPHRRRNTPPPPRDLGAIDLARWLALAALLLYLGELAWRRWPARRSRRTRPTA